MPAKRMSVSKSVEKPRVSRKVVVSAGDLFLISQSNHRFTLGQVLAQWQSLKGVITVVLFGTELDTVIANPKYCREVATKNSSEEEIAAVVSTGDGAIRAGQWQKIETCPVTLPEHFLPEHPFRSKSIAGAEVLSAPLIEGFVEAYRGLSDWDSLLPGQPGYLKSLVFKAP
jgi:hypothetical protein